MRKGFTLIELLIVITIMAILAGAAVPYVQDYVEDSRIAKCREDLGELRNAIMRYEVERDRLFDPVTDAPGATEKERLANWQQMLVGPFMTQALTDPWGRPYYFSNAASMVFSAAEDGDKNTNIISVDCRPAMAPTRAWWYDVDRNGAVTEKDYVDIKFTRPIGTLADLASLEISQTGATWTAMVPTDDGIICTSDKCNPVHPKGQNWVRITVGATPSDVFMAGSLIRAKANSIIDATPNCDGTAGDAGTVGIYNDKIKKEGLFETAHIPPTASTAAQVPVSIKAAQ